MADAKHRIPLSDPQIDGLGFSSVSQRYSVKSSAEAEAHLSHPVLGPRLLACAEAALGVEGRSALDILGSSRRHARAPIRAAVVFARPHLTSF